MSGKKTTKKFSVEFMRDVLWGDAANVEIIKNEIFDTTRWSNCYELIFDFEDKLWMCSYDVGATEQQEQRPWEYEDHVECVLVKPVEKTVIDYVPV